MLPIVHHQAYHAEIPTHHRFPMDKFRLLMDILKQDGLARDDNTFEPIPAPASWLTLAHSQTYVDQMLSGNVPDKIEKDIGLPINPSVVMRAQCATGGTVLAAKLAMKHGIAANTAGGSHHARRAQGAGFCVFNDVAVAVEVLKSEGLIKKALVIDLDVHQGDGTADIFRNNEDVFTFSLHGANNYPTTKIPSDLDIALSDGTTDSDYLRFLQKPLTRLFSGEKPDIVFYNAGIDPHKEDRLGRLSLTDDGLITRDHKVIKTVRGHNIPLVCVIGGGYMKDVEQVARRHSLIHRTATAFIRDGQKPSKIA